MYAVMLIFFLANAVEGQLISTGAFEVELNGSVNSLQFYCTIE